MEKIRQEFTDYFYAEDKEKAVLFVLDLLKRQKIDIITLYNEILAPALNGLRCDLEDKRICIWKEHVKTAIIRTIVENCYPYVLAKRDEQHQQRKGKVAVVCPPEEYHDIGARIIADYFTIGGFDTVFVGSGTPYQDFYNAIAVIRPCLIAISVSNYFNLVATKRMIEELKAAVDYPVKIVVGGNAFADGAEHKVQTVKADYYARTYEDIINLIACGEQQ